MPTLSYCPAPTSTPWRTCGQQWMCLRLQCTPWRHLSLLAAESEPSGKGRTGMLNWLRKRRERREKVKTTAEVLIAAHGSNAWAVAYGMARDFSTSEEDRQQARAVRDEIGRRLGIKWQPDTATRFL